MIDQYLVEVLQISVAVGVCLIIIYIQLQQLKAKDRVIEKLYNDKEAKIPRLYERIIDEINNKLKDVLDILKKRY
jgi:uncharacterized membrane protein